MTQPVEQMVWKCEQWFGGTMREQNVFLSEEQARAFARRISGADPRPGAQDRAHAHPARLELR